MGNSRPHLRSSSMALTVEMTGVRRARSLSTNAIPNQANGTQTERTAAMRNLLSSERTYADALAVVCDVHIPLAQGKPACIPSPASVSPNHWLRPSPFLRFTALNSFTSPQQFGPLMTSDDVVVVFRNIGDIASFSSQFVKGLEMACYGDDHEDRVGELFLEIIPQLKSLYRTYLRSRPAAFACLQWLSTLPAYRTYCFNVLNFLSNGTQIPDLLFFLMKPELHVPEYCRLLSAINTAAPARCKDLMAPLARALDLMEGVARELKNDREANELPQLAARLHAYPAFLDRLAECIQDLEVATRCSIKSLQRWAITFGDTVFGSPPSSSIPDPFGYDAFTSFLLELCISLEGDTQITINPLLRKLKMMTENPKRLLSEMYALEIPRTPTPLARLRRPDTPKNRHRYLLLRSQLLSQLPILLDVMDRAVGLVIRMVAEGFLKTVKEKWVKFFDSMVEEGEHHGGPEVTLRAWQVRWEAGQQEFLMWKRISLLREGNVWSIHPSAGSLINLPVRLLVTSAELPPINDGLSMPLSAPPRLRMRFSFPPSSRPSSWMRRSSTGGPSVLYTIRVLQSYNPPPHSPYQDHSFFNLVVGDCFEVLEEHNHPLAHADLPQHFVSKRDEDCLLKVRARNRGLGYEAGDVGWALARFVSVD